MVLKFATSLPPPLVALCLSGFSGIVPIGIHAFLAGEDLGGKQADKPVL